MEPNPVIPQLRPSNSWIVRVGGKEYGPVALEELRAWKNEGRLIPGNEVRQPGSPHWHRADELVELFSDLPPVVEASPEEVTPRSLREILGRTWQIYRGGFWQFLGLTALLLVPSLCAQVSGAAVGTPANGEIDLRSAVLALFNFGMMLATLFAWPIYIAGLQILTRARNAQQPISLRDVITTALRSWTRVAGLCLLVYGGFVLLTGFAFAILLLASAAAESMVMALLSLALLAFQVWMFGRFFINVLFWQQAAVLEKTHPLEALRRSKELAHSRPDRPWSKRPAFRGALIASLWCLFATALTVGPEWSALTSYFHSVMTARDPQSILESINSISRPAGFLLPLLLGVVQAVFRPLLGIAFVLLYFDTDPKRAALPND